MAYILLICPAWASNVESRQSPRELSPPVNLRLYHETHRGNRVIGIDLGTASGSQFEEAFELAVSAGMTETGLFLTWNMVEVAPGSYDGAIFEMASAFYANRNIAIDLTLAPVNTNRKEFPADLADEPFDDSVVIARFKQMLDFVLSQTSSLDLSSLNIGCEYDVYFGVDATQWGQFLLFYEEVVSHIKATRPGLLVSTESTFEGTVGYARQPIEALHQFSDIIGVSYYGLLENDDVKDPSAVHTDFNLLVELYPDKPIFFYQFGYPSSNALNSSEEKQQQFIIETFRAWDRYAPRIQMIDFTWLHDKSQEEVQQFAAYYGIWNPKFLEFLATLGMRTHDGQDKPAFNALQTAAEARGW